ncbi:hypothetical protein Daesc_000529 [Daldinia eschscholtzii]|uniref:Myb-like domain-containing protein n=1 Tax=Daldinia eschscholtzii TaxID=292717 RepID=A0AAX6MZW4_9PEZI
MSAGKGGKAWSPQEKLNLLIQVIDRINPAGRGIPFAELNMPGRTVRSLKHTWSGLRAEAAAYRTSNDSDQEAGTAASTNGNSSKKSLAKSVDAATPRRGSRQRTQKRSYSEWVSDDEEDKVSVKRSCLSSDEDKKLEDSEEDSAATVTKSKPVRSTKGAKKGEPPVKLEASADDDDDDVENFAEA